MKGQDASAGDAFTMGFRTNPEEEDWIVAAATTRKIQVLRKLPMPKAAPKSPSSVPASYEQAQTELEQLVARLETGDLPLEQLLSGYQRGAELLKFCRDKLQAVEEQIKVLDGATLKTWTQQ